jgi:hypothetical protein
MKSTLSGLFLFVAAAISAQPFQPGTILGMFNVESGVTKNDIQEMVTRPDASQVCALVIAFYETPRPFLRPEGEPARKSQAEYCRAHVTTTPEAIASAKAFVQGLSMQPAGYKPPPIDTKGGRAWLGGLLNTFLDEAAGMSVDARSSAGLAAIDGLTRMNGGIERFEAALRALVLRPDDPAAAAAIVLYTPEAAYATKGASIEETTTFVADTFTSREKQDGIAWKRGRRNYLAIKGDYEVARTIARELARAPRDGQKSLDAIYAAVIERALGNRGAYDALLANCPAPDAEYVRGHPASPRPAVYCENTIAAFARNVRDVRGASTPADVIAMLAETNRTVADKSVHAPVNPPVASAPSRLEVERTQTADNLAALVNTTHDQAQMMSTAERERVAREICSDYECRPTAEQTIRLLILAPSWRSAPPLVLWATQFNSESDAADDKAAHLRAVVSAIYERYANTAAPDQDDWRRAWRMHLLFTGEYEKARSLSRVIGTGKPFVNPEADPSVDALISWCLGDPAPYQRLPNHDYSLSLSFYGARALREKLPKPFLAILRTEAFNRARNVDDRIRAARCLTDVDRRVAAAVYKEFIDENVLPAPAFRLEAYYWLAFDARERSQMAEARNWLDKAFTEANIHDLPATAVHWANVGGAIAAAPYELFTLPQLRVELAIATHDWAAARQSVEFTLHSIGYAPNAVYHQLLQLAEAEADASIREEPLRIVGYVSMQAGLWADDTKAILRIRTKLGKNGQPADAKPQTTPWDPRPPLPEPGRPKPDSKPVIKT